MDSPAPLAIPVIVNSAAGPGHTPQAVERLQALFDDARIRVRILAARSGAELTQLAKEAMAARPRVIVAAGGDGTVSATAQQVRGTDTALGVLPLGTFNHFARDLGIPTDPEGAVRTIAQGERVAVDVGEVNGGCFLNNASLGIYPVIVRGRELQQRRLGRRKYPAMVWATLAALRRSPFMRLKLQLDDRDHDCRSPFVFIGNNEYRMSGFDIGTRARIDCGRLSVYTTPRCSRWGLMTLALHALIGRLEQAQDFSAMAARTVRVDSGRSRILVATDGEVAYMPTPLEFRIVPKSLWVMAPPRHA